MEGLSNILLGAGGFIYLVLGTLHWVYTFYTPRFRPYDESVEAGMKATTPRLTKRTTMWKAWMGFNGSHSTGAMFFGFMALYFSMAAMPVFKSSMLLQAVVLINSAYYLYLGKKYWFSIPRNGIILATIFFTIAIVLLYI